MGYSITKNDNISENYKDVEIKEINQNNPPNPQNFYNNQSLPINSSIKDILNQIINNSHSIFSFRFENQTDKSNNNNNNNTQNIQIQNIEEHKEIKEDNIIINQNKTSNKIFQTLPKQYNQNSNNIINQNIQNSFNKNQNPFQIIQNQIPFQTQIQNKENEKNQTDQNFQNIYNNIPQIQNPYSQNQQNQILQNQPSKKTEYQIKQYSNYNQLEEEKNPSSPKERTPSILFENPIKFQAGSLLQDIRKIYKIKNSLGGGHFGKVRKSYRRNEKFPPFYAIKSISKKNLTEKDLEDLIKEVDIISGLDHPNIIKFYETYHDQSYFHIVMEYCQGKEIFDRIVEDGRIKEKKVCMIIMKVLHAISYCHSRGITHRDLKPENILFETLEQDSEIKLIDFGLSRKYYINEKMHTILGTPYYVAPEVLQGEYDEKCDIWSIGALTYIMLCGDPPFKGTSNNEIFNKILREDVKFSSNKWNNISDDARNFVKECLNKIPEKRPNAIQLFEHNWFKDILNEVHSVKYISVDILNNLKNFSIKAKFTKMVIRYLLKSLSDQEKDVYRKAFYAMNFKHTGSIDLDELEKSFEIGKVNVKRDDLIKLIKLADENNKGSLDYTELLIASINKKDLFTEEKLKMAFQYFDVNNSGIIESSDLKDAMLRFGKKIINSEDVNKLIQEVTKNMLKDSLSLDEFMNIFQNLQ